MSLKDSIKRMKEKGSPIDWRVLAMDIAEKMINEKLIEFQKKTDLLVNNSIKELQKEVSEFANELIPSLKGAKGDSIRGVQGFKGDKGDRGDKGGTGNPGINGVDGKSGIDGSPGADGKDGINGKDGSPDTPIQIADKLNTLEEKVEWKVIKGLTKMFANLSREIRGKKQVGGGGMGNVVRFAFNGDGTTTAFTLSAEVAGGGSAIIAHLNGQYIHQTTQFNVSSRTLTTTFTMTNTDILEGWFIRT